MRDWGRGGGSRNIIICCCAKAHVGLSFYGLIYTILFIWIFCLFFFIYSVTSVMLKAVIVVHIFLLFPTLFYYICILLSDSLLLCYIEFSYSRVPQIPCTMLPGRLNLLQWRLICVGSKYGVCFVSSFRCLVI
jgi:hypothetical protein